MKDVRIPLKRCRNVVAEFGRTMDSHIANQGRGQFESHVIQMRKPLTEKVCLKYAAKHLKQFHSDYWGWLQCAAMIQPIFVPLIVFSIINDS
jgi:hypothetical protein